MEFNGAFLQGLQYESRVLFGANDTATESIVCMVYGKEAAREKRKEGGNKHAPLIVRIRMNTHTLMEINTHMPSFACSPPEPASASFITGYLLLGVSNGMLKLLFLGITNGMLKLLFSVFVDQEGTEESCCLSTHRCVLLVRWREVVDRNRHRRHLSISVADFNVRPLFSKNSALTQIAHQRLIARMVSLQLL